MPLGETIRAARTAKGLTQARLAKRAGVSRRHLAALEKGANVSVAVLNKVAAVLELKEIDLGELTLRGGLPHAELNVALLAETLQEASCNTVRTQTLLARAEQLLGKGSEATGVSAVIPPLVAMPLDVAPHHTASGAIADEIDVAHVPIAAEVRQGAKPEELKGGDVVALPTWMIEEGEIVFRARGDAMRNVGIEDGDLLVIELRQRGRAATGELVIGRVGEECFIGRWWQKHGKKSLVSDNRAEIAIAPSKPLKIVAAINCIVRPKQD